MQDCVAVKADEIDRGLGMADAELTDGVGMQAGQLGFDRARNRSRKASG
jgi:hypothetical protein